MIEEILLDNIKEAKILGVFKNICDSHFNVIEKYKLRNILFASSDKISTLKFIVSRKYNEDLSSEEIKRLLDLVEAFLNKSKYRKKISDEIKKKLLANQNYECALCHIPIDQTAHADHIVPFKYVGDELNNNLQMLCKSCNEKKNDSLDYQIRFLLRLV